MNSALWEAMLTERVRDRQADACKSRIARQVRRARRYSRDQIVTEEGQLGCLQATRLRSA